MDRDLLEVTIPQLEQLYRRHKYTVTQVVRWYMARIEKLQNYKINRLSQIPCAVFCIVVRDSSQEEKEERRPAV